MFKFSIYLIKKDPIIIFSPSLKHTLQEFKLFGEPFEIEKIIVGDDYIIPENVIQEYKNQVQSDFNCPEKYDPITFEEFKTSRQIIFKDEYFSNCYLIDTVLKFITSSLEKTRNDTFFPMWPSDPFTLKPLSPQKIINFYKYCTLKNMNIAKIFTVFINCILNNTININVAMSGPFDNNDRIKPVYMDLFIAPFKKELTEKKEHVQDYSLDIMHGESSIIETIIDNIDILPTLLL